MAIYRCNKCGYLEETLEAGVGTQKLCPKCGQANTTYDTLFFVRKLLEKHFALLSSVRRQEAEAQEKEVARATPGEIEWEGIDLHNTDRISSDVQHGPIHDWFKARNIQVQPDYKAVDTTGFFDEVAVEIGRDFELFKPLVDQIRYSQAKNHTSISINLSKRSQKEQQQLTAFCRQLYDYSFVSKYFYQKNEKIIRLNLQSSVPVRSFFAGDWLEWYALMQVLAVIQRSGPRSACTRGLSIVFPNEDLHEIDVFAIVGKEVPVCVECKSGEFRPYIEKYTALRKRLGLSPSQFIVCVAGLADEHVQGLSAMHELTFVSPAGLSAHLERLAAEH